MQHISLKTLNKLDSEQSLNKEDQFEEIVEYPKTLVTNPTSEVLLTEIDENNIDREQQLKYLLSNTDYTMSLINSKYFDRGNNLIKTLKDIE